MPLYAFFCPSCHRHVERNVHMRVRDHVDCEHCGQRLKRFFAVPHAAPIPGIPNRVNRHWNEEGTPIDRGRMDDFIDRAVK